MTSVFIRHLPAAIFTALLSMSAAFAQDIQVSDAYARAASKAAKAGAVFLTIKNDSDTEDRLLSASTPAAALAEVHTHISAQDGVMRMEKVEGGLPLPAHGEIHMQRGADHIMLMGLTQPLNEGDTIPMTLLFEKAGEISLDVPVDLSR